MKNIFKNILAVISNFVARVIFKGGKMAENNKPLTEYNEGNIFEGQVITRLYSAKSDYMIYEGDNSGDVTIYTDIPELRKRCSKICIEISLITEYLKTKSEKKKFVDQIGLAYSEVIENNIDEAKAICKKILERIEIYKRNIGKFYYMLSCLSLVLFNFIFSYFLKKFEFIPEIIPLYYVITYSSIGGFLSVARNIRSIQIDSTDFGWFQFMYGTLRILISMFSGLIIYVLIKSGLLLPQLNLQENIFITYTIAVIAGFSETLVPNLLTKIETEKLITQNPGTE